MSWRCPIGEVRFGEKGGTEHWLHVNPDSESKRYLELLSKEPSSVNSKLVSYIIPLELCLPETAAKSVRNVETTLRSVTACGLTLLCVHL